MIPREYGAWVKFGVSKKILDIWPIPMKYMWYRCRDFNPEIIPATLENFMGFNSKDFFRIHMMFVLNDEDIAEISLSPPLGHIGEGRDWTLIGSWFNSLIPKGLGEGELIVVAGDERLSKAKFDTYEEARKNTIKLTREYMGAVVELVDTAKSAES